MEDDRAVSSLRRFAALSSMMVLSEKCFLRKGIAKRGRAGYNNLRNKIQFVTEMQSHSRMIWLLIQSGRGSVW